MCTSISSSCLGPGDAVIVSGDSESRTMASEFDRAVALDCRFGSDIVPFGGLVDLQRDHPLSSGVVVLFPGISFEVRNLDVHS